MKHTKNNEVYVFSILGKHIEEVGLSVLLINNCKQFGTETLQAVLEKTEVDGQLFTKIFGEYAQDELRKLFEHTGLRFKETITVMFNHKILMKYPISLN